MQPEPKKGLGQNFLVNLRIRHQIVSSCAFAPSDTVLEIGAGRGELTCIYAKLVKKVYAFELDKGLCEILKERLKLQPNLKIIPKDALSVSWKRYFEGEKIKIIGNIPYYLSTPIIQKTIESRQIVKEAFFTLQKEFAKRLVADKGGKEFGSLSCFVQYYSQPKILFFIARGNFWPVPKVDSAFVRIDLSSGFGEKANDEARLFRIIRHCFQQRRKTLRNSLKGIVSPSRLNTFFTRYKIDSNVRAENLSLLGFVRLSNI